MDVDLSSSDDPIPWELLQRFSCLNTNDRDVLMKQFMTLLGEKCTESDAEFWLDMNNWNLQAAVCAYFDNESTSPNFVMMMKLPSIQITPMTGNSSEYLPNSSFTYCCTVTNTGDEQWPGGCCLKFISGEKMTTEERYVMPQLQPGQSCELSLHMTSPEKAGMYFSHWRPATITGQYFGTELFIFVSVLDDLNQVTEQLSAASLSQLQQQMCSTGVMVTDQPIMSTFCKTPSIPGVTNGTVANHSTEFLNDAENMQPIGTGDVFLHNHNSNGLIPMQQQHDNDSTTKNRAENTAETDVPLPSNHHVLDDNSMS